MCKFYFLQRTLYHDHNQASGKKKKEKLWMSSLSMFGGPMQPNGIAFAAMQARSCARSFAPLPHSPLDFQLLDLGQQHGTAVQLYASQPNAFIEAGLWWMHAYHSLAENYTDVTLITNDVYLTMAREARRHGIANIETDLALGLQRFEERMVASWVDGCLLSIQEGRDSPPPRKFLLIVHWQGMDFPSCQETIWHQATLQRLVRQCRPNQCSVWISSSLRLTGNHASLHASGIIQTPDDWLFASHSQSLPTLAPTARDASTSAPLAQIQQLPLAIRHWICPVSVLEFLRRDAHAVWSRHLQTNALPTGVRHLEPAPRDKMRLHQRYVSRAQPTTTDRNQWFYYQVVEDVVPVLDVGDEPFEEAAVSADIDMFQDERNVYGGRAAAASSSSAAAGAPSVLPPPPQFWNVNSLLAPMHMPPALLSLVPNRDLIVGAVVISSPVVIPPVSTRRRHAIEATSVSAPVSSSAILFANVQAEADAQAADRHVVAKRRRMLQKQLIHTGSVSNMLERMVKQLQPAREDDDNRNDGDTTTTASVSPTITTTTTIITKQKWGCGICLAAFQDDTTLHPMALSCGHMICVQCMVDRARTCDAKLRAELADLDFQDAATAIRQQLARDPAGGECFVCPWCRSLLRSVVKLNPLPL